MFKPRGVPVSDLDIIAITIDEFEALRLADLLGHSQEEAAAKMNVSRSTFGRIVERARRKVADALIHSKALEIGGGEFVQTHHKHVRCGRCKRPWEVPSPIAGSFRCPHCHTKEG